VVTSPSQIFIHPALWLINGVLFEKITKGDFGKSHLFESSDSLNSLFSNIL
jgi:hypothetical protein